MKYLQIVFPVFHKNCTFSEATGTGFFPIFHSNYTGQLLSPEELNECIQGCVLNQRESQKKIYSSFYAYAMAICDRYSNQKDDTIEILNDGFLKVFREMHHFKPAYADVVSSFKGWLRKIMIYTSIDHFRKNQKHQVVSGMDEAIVFIPSKEEDAIDKISYEEIILAIRELSPAYRTVFNLFVIDGYSHEEIARELGISVGTSKSNLAKARRQLQKILFKKNLIEKTRNVV